MPYCKSHLKLKTLLSGGEGSCCYCGCCVKLRIFSDWQCKPFLVTSWISVILVRNEQHMIVFLHLMERKRRNCHCTFVYWILLEEKWCLMWSCQHFRKAGYILSQVKIILSLYWKLFTVYNCRNLGRYTLFWSTAKGETFQCIFNNDKEKCLKQLLSTLCSN